MMARHPQPEDPSMPRLIRALLSALFLFALAGAARAEPVLVVMKTSKGDVTLELDADKAPDTVRNFLRYVDEGFYDGTVFHRVIKNFMIQGGGFTPDMKQKKTHEPVKNEAKNGLKNLRGTLAMARTSDPHSATAQFFINHKDNDFLDYPGQDGWGYTVFGKVTGGMEVVDAIATVPTGSSGGFRDVPTETVTILSVKRAK
jgi:cyclophilin family peptidyl-prolyl cis-trans isomerase